MLLNVPTAQSSQSLLESWKSARLPLSLRNFPGEHLLQLLEPLYGAYSPSPQMKHDDVPPIEYVPAAHGEHAWKSSR